MRFLRHKLGSTRLDWERNQSVREKFGVRNTVLEKYIKVATYREWTKTGYPSRH
jgi:hypothetical protein